MPSANTGQAPTLAPRKEFFSQSSPIGVIGAFAALVELALITAVIFGEGNIRWAALFLAAFFFVLTAGPFFYVLWHRPEVLYPPREYGTTSVADYADAMRQRSTALSGEKIAEYIEVSVGKAIKEAKQEVTLAIEAKTDTDNLTTAEIVRRDVEAILGETFDLAAKNAAERVREELFIEVSGPLSEEGGFITDLIPVDETTTADGFVGRTVGLTTDPFSILKPEEFTKELIDYGRVWALADEESGKVFNEMGPLWAVLHGQAHDERPIFEIGLRPGMSLTKVHLNPFASTENPASDGGADEQSSR